MSEPTNGSSWTVADFVGQIDGIERELKSKFTKAYSAGRLEAILSHLSTLRMNVEHIHDEEVREEHQDRKDSVAQSMILAGRSMSEARDAVERGER